ncbi:hypothetical protein L227DRAFT_617991 [Lentinus tigrinus ALCF2SS1-6]|uniref:Uncharacterized protein n=1 Tax=Lentinus tigrinus ALCF2SS1-6 TaxID=1328759 RepID=A0A5C2RPT6_9APHY|nr:hypothetical protein L227DRAFT_617991 [Lentinus tigrinus ALCF2SS1-6]
MEEPEHEAVRSVSGFSSLILVGAFSVASRMAVVHASHWPSPKHCGAIAKQIGVIDREDQSVALPLRHAVATKRCIGEGKAYYCVSLAFKGRSNSPSFPSVRCGSLRRSWRAYLAWCTPLSMCPGPALVSALTREGY